MKMKTILVSFYLLCSILIFAQSENNEFRSTWVITWNWISPDDSMAETQARILEILDNHVAANMTSVLFQVRQSGTAYYNSSYEPWGYYSGYQNPGFDPLEFAVEQAHLRGLEFHAWFNVFSCSSTQPGTPAYDHPEWVCRDRDGIPMSSYRALSPGLTDVRDYTNNVAMEIVNNYDIDGLHLDYIRWNEYTNSSMMNNISPEEETKKMDGIISPELLNELENNRSGRYLYDTEHPYSAGVPEGFSSWEEWWRWSVTTFVNTLHDSIQAVKPFVRLSVAALGKYNWSSWQGYGTVYQDAALWFNEGFIEQLTPMHYHWTTANQFLGMLTDDCPECWVDHIEAGIESGRLYTVGPGSYMLDNYNAWNNHPSIINTCRTIPWVDGYQFFSSEQWDYYDYWNYAGDSFFNSQVKIRPIINNNGTAPDQPGLSLIKIDSLTYSLTITPSDTMQDNWFAIYRFIDDSINVSEDEIIHIQFNNEFFTIVDEFNGLQDYNGQYSYSATQLDRYWNESLPSIPLTSDSIPSFPPTVIGTNPADSTMIDISGPLQIQFSKTMDIESVNNSSVIISPSVSSTMTWSDSNHLLTLHLLDNLDYDLEYFIILEPSIMDINGALLDGNMDGTGGDAYSFYFWTVEEDIYGPTVYQSNIDFQSDINLLDIQDVITIVFDEIVNQSTLSESTVNLYQENNAVAYDTHVSEHNDKTVLTIRPVEPLLPITDYELVLSSGIEDMLGNPIPADILGSIQTTQFEYSEISIIDNFDNINNWWQPTGSGSTVGVLAGTEFATSNSFYLPGTSPQRSAKLSYVWDLGSADHLLREYLSGGPPRDVHFNSSFILQCYVYGDGSYNLFRFCVDDHVPDAAAAYHEVSEWFLIDWIGWRLIEWDLGTDPVGTWIGNGLLEGNLRIDSFQMTLGESGTSEGAIYFDNFRVVIKNILSTDDEFFLPDKIVLSQNYPNPFNADTWIRYYIPSSQDIDLTIYDILGRNVIRLDHGYKDPGLYQVRWNGKNSKNETVSSGVYIYLLKNDNIIQRKRMILLK